MKNINGHIDENYYNLNVKYLIIIKINKMYNLWH